MGKLMHLKPKLLLIVDNWELLERYEERFSEAFEVLCAPLGVEGIRIAREESPDVILLNLVFENVTNEELCMALHADPATREIPIAAIGDGGPGVNHWLKEPVSVQAVLALISR